MNTNEKNMKELTPDVLQNVNGGDIIDVLNKIGDEIFDLFGGTDNM